MKKILCVLILNTCLSLSWASHAAPNAAQQERAFSFLNEHFTEHPKQILRGKVISRGTSIESGEALLYIDFPTSLSFQYTGKNSFDSIYSNKSYTVKSYPQGRAKEAKVQKFSQLDNLMISTLVSTMTSIKEESISSFLLGQFFDWKFQFKSNLYTLSVTTTNELNTLKKMELRFNEKKQLSFIQTEVTGADASIYEFYVVEASFPKSIPASTFK